METEITSEVPNQVLAAAVNFCRQWYRRGMLTTQDCGSHYELVVKAGSQLINSPALQQLNLWTDNLTAAAEFIIKYSGIAYSANIYSKTEANDSFRSF